MKTLLKSIETYTFIILFSKPRSPFSIVGLRAQNHALGFGLCLRRLG